MEFIFQKEIGIKSFTLLHVFRHFILIVSHFSNKVFFCFCFAPFAIAYNQQQTTPNRDAILFKYLFLRWSFVFVFIMCIFGRGKKNIQKKQIAKKKREIAKTFFPSTKNENKTLSFFVLFGTFFSSFLITSVQ
jgi:hypothetical protein